MVRFGTALCCAFSTLLAFPFLWPQPPRRFPDERKIIIFVWDGLRPDSVTAKDTPNLYAMREAGVNFTDNHSTYPTFTMMNAASFATGSFSGTTGYYGNTLWQPGAAGDDSAGKPFDFQQPVFTEDTPSSRI